MPAPQTTLQVKKALQSSPAKAATSTPAKQPVKTESPKDKVDPSLNGYDMNIPTTPKAGFFFASYCTEVEYTRNKSSDNNNVNYFTYS